MAQGRVPLQDPSNAASQGTVLRQAGATALGLHVSERRYALAALDGVLLSLALLFALWVRTVLFPDLDEVGFYPLRLAWWATLLVLWYPTALVADAYNLRIARRPVRSAVYAGTSALVTAALYLVIPVVTAPLTRSRLSWLLFAIAAVLLVGAGRVAYARFSRISTLARRVLILGTGQGACALASELADRGEWSGLQLVGFLADDRQEGERVAGSPILGATADLLTTVNERGIQDVVVAMDGAESGNAPLLEALTLCSMAGVDVLPMSIYYEQLTGAVPAQHLGRYLISLVGTSDGTGVRMWDALRRGLDLLVGLLGLAITAMLYPAIALAIALDSRGPILYRQERVGLAGRVFWLAKFRSMVPDAESEGAVWATQGDVRVTRVGRFLRSTRLDELPQFLNLVNGTMTLIGPRPERPVFVAQLSDAFPCYPIRHSIRPGLTGWAQVRFRYGSTVEDSLEKLRYDLYYIKHRGPVLDALICLYTFRVIARMEGYMPGVG